MQKPCPGRIRAWDSRSCTSVSPHNSLFCGGGSPGRCAWPLRGCMAEPALKLCSAWSCPGASMVLMPCGLPLFKIIENVLITVLQTLISHVDYTYIGTASRSSIKSLVVEWKFIESTNGYDHKAL